MNECTVHPKDICLYSQLFAPDSKYKYNLQSRGIYLFFLLKEKKDQSKLTFKGELNKKHHCLTKILEAKSKPL